MKFPLKESILLVPLVGLFILLSGCPRKVKPAEENPSDTYCSYTISSITGENAEHKVGDIICRLCPEGVVICKADLEIKVGDTKYKLERVEDFLTCQNCHGQAVAKYADQ